MTGKRAGQGKPKRKPRVVPTVQQTAKEPEAFIIPTQVLIGVIQYLQKRPYEEVAEGLSSLTNLSPYEPPAEAS